MVMAAVLIFFGFVIIFILIFIFSGGNDSPKNGVLYTKDGLYRKNGNKGFVSSVESALLGETESLQAIDVSKIPVESFGRRRGSFGHWGYCVTNPICINGMDRNLQAYISHLCYGSSRIESYDTEEVYSVSIFDKPVYKISLLVKDSRKIICLYFIESDYMNVEIFPDGFSDYGVYMKKQQTNNSGDSDSPRFSLKDKNESVSDYPRLSLKGNYRNKLYQCLSLEKYEKNTKRNDVIVKRIWKK